MAEIYKRFCQNWQSAPRGLRWLVASVLALTALSVLVNPKWTGLGRLALTLLLVYHLLDKGQGARGTAIALSVGAALLVLSNLKVAPILFGAYFVYCLWGAAYLVLSPSYKQWLRSANALPDPINQKETL